MTVPKGKGYRRIVVGGRRFKWRFADRIVVVPDGLAGRRVLDIDFGWFDCWLYTNYPTEKPPAFSPQAATPAFVSSAIEFALKSGWDTDVRGGRFMLKYSADGGFQTATGDVLPNKPLPRTVPPRGNRTSIKKPLVQRSRR